MIIYLRYVPLYVNTFVYEMLLISLRNRATSRATTRSIILHLTSRRKRIKVSVMHYLSHCCIEASKNFISFRDRVRILIEVLMSNFNNIRFHSEVFSHTHLHNSTTGIDTIFSFQNRVPATRQAQPCQDFSEEDIRTPTYCVITSTSLQ